MGPTDRPASPPPPRRLVRMLAVEADCAEHTALRALIYGPECVAGYELRARLRAAIQRVTAVGDGPSAAPMSVSFGEGPRSR
jgi:hypothetical protein